MISRIINYGCTVVLLFLVVSLIQDVDSENATCKWHGEAPFCGSTPEDCFVSGTGYVKQDKSGDGDTCWTGSKTLCCDRKEPAPCNGIKEMCFLKFNHVTFPGAHNSGAGYNGVLKYGIGIDAISCFYQNQGMSFTNQLEFGIRYFDIDLCWHDEKIYTCHEKAYAGPISEVFSQISDWMNKPANKAQVIVILIDDVDFRKEHMPNLIEELYKAFPGTENKTGLNNHLLTTRSWPTLGEAVNANKRVFFFAGDNICNIYCRWNNTFVHSRFFIGDTWEEIGISFDCNELSDVTKKKCEEQAYHPLVVLSHFASYGLCTWDMARKCDTQLRKDVMMCENSRRNRNMTVNFIIVDFPEKASIGKLVTDVAMELNKRNIDTYLHNLVELLN